MSIFPYAFQMVSDFSDNGIKEVNAMYAGLLTSSFALAEFATAVLWGRLSDKIGRKPVLLLGLASTAFSMTLLGFSTSIKAALIARALGGLLNGNIGVINTTVAELVTEQSQQDRAFCIMPGIWCIGGIFGAMIGGLLADPVSSWPAIFSESSIFRHFPYLLPNLVCTVVVLLSLATGILLLEETHAQRKHKRDHGLVIGKKFLALISIAREPGYNEVATAEQTFMDKESHDSEITSRTLLPPALTPRNSLDGLKVPMTSLAPAYSQTRRSLVSRQTVLIITSMGIVAYHTIAMEQLLPIMLSLPEAKGSTRLPVHFAGGFGMTTQHIGTILAGQGIVQVLATFIAFPWLAKHLGSLPVYRMTTLSYPLLYILLPYTTILPSSLRAPCLAICLIWKVTAQACAFPPLSIALTNSSPSTADLGTLFGAFAAAASLSRAVGPTVSGLLQGIGLSVEIMALPWWINSLVAVVGFVLSLAIRSTTE